MKKIHPSVPTHFTLACALYLVAFFPSAKAAVIFATDFNSYTVGDLYGQDSWRVDQAPPTNNSSVIQNTVTISGNALRLQASAEKPTAIWAAHSFDLNSNTKLTLEVSMGSLATQRRSASILLNSGVNPWDPTVAGVRGYANAGTGWVEHFFYRNSNGTWTDTGITMNAATWYDIRIEVDLTLNIYDFYLKERTVEIWTLAASDIATNAGAGTPNWLQLQRLYPGSDNNVFFDNISLTAVPEPSVGLLAFCGVVLMMAFKRRKM